MPSERSNPSALPVPPPAVIVLFGASGDLAQRKLAPALHSLACAGRLAPQTRIVGAGRTPMTDEVFRARLYRGVEDYARLKPDPKLCKLWSDLGERFTYFRMSTEDSADYVRLAAHLDRGRIAGPAEGNLLFHLAVPPDATAAIIRGLATSGLAAAGHGWRRILLEKPFGVDLASSRSLDRVVHGVFAETDVYRIDHYLGKETVQNLLAFRFANAIFEPLWRREYVHHVQITAGEALRVGERSAFYDRVGVLRDVVQNHLLQLVALVAMEPPALPTAEALRDEKVKVLGAVRALRPEDVILGQYSGYRDEPGVAAESKTPTFASLRLRIDNRRWKSVPFFLRAGKALPSTATEITLQFVDVPHRLFPSAGASPNRLTLRIQPNEQISLEFQVKSPGPGMNTHPFRMRFDYEQAFGASALPDAYERLLLDALSGDPSLFIRSDEIEACWKILDPILPGAGPPPFYEPGTWGPNESGRMLVGTGADWFVPEPGECSHDG